MKGLTIDEIAEELGIPWKTAHKRIETLGIKPLSYKALYDPAVVETIRNVPGKGRPKNPVVEKAIEAQEACNEAIKSGNPKEIFEKNKHGFEKTTDLIDVIRSAQGEELKELLDDTADFNLKKTPRKPKK